MLRGRRGQRNVRGEENDASNKEKKIERWKREVKKSQ